MKKLGVCLLLAGCLTGLWHVQAVRAKTITMAFEKEPDKEPLFMLAQMLYTEAFKRLGMTFAYRVYPGQRCSVMANTGRVDGEPGRFIGYSQICPNMVRVEESVATLHEAAFAKDASISLNGWESLKGTDLRVAYILGCQAEEVYLPKVVRPERLSRVATIEQALIMLDAGRTDVLIQTESSVMAVLLTPKFKDFKIVKVGIMEELDVYPFLHKRHAELAPKLARVLKEMKAQGLLEENKRHMWQLLKRRDP